MPGATRAAWLVMPPRAVRMPRAACMPWMSSGLVSVRTRITARLSADQRSAVLASNVLNSGTCSALRKWTNVSLAGILPS